MIAALLAVLVVVQLAHLGMAIWTFRHHCEQLAHQRAAHVETLTQRGQAHREVLANRNPHGPVK